MVKAPNLTKFINHTNRITNFIVTEILSQRTLRGILFSFLPLYHVFCLFCFFIVLFFISYSWLIDIADYITFWIKVGEQFQILKNYNGVMNILTALHSSTIGRIKNAWNVC